jgi:hypothetical protein
MGGLDDFTTQDFVDVYYINSGIFSKGVFRLLEPRGGAAAVVLSCIRTDNCLLMKMVVFSVTVIEARMLLLMRISAGCFWRTGDAVRRNEANSRSLQLYDPLFL